MAKGVNRCPERLRPAVMVLKPTDGIFFLPFASNSCIEGIFTDSPSGRKGDIGDGKRCLAKGESSCATG